MNDNSGAQAPIDMVLHCPKCGTQHIDQPEGEIRGGEQCWDWTNPPHRSHLCRGCGHIWRPADVPTNGVAAVQTRGSADSPICATRAPGESQIGMPVSADRAGLCGSECNDL